MIKAALSALLASHVTLTMAAPNLPLDVRDLPDQDVDTWCKGVGDLSKMETVKDIYQRVSPHIVIDFFVRGKSTTANSTAPAFRLTPYPD